MRKLRWDKYSHECALVHGCTHEDPYLCLKKGKKLREHAAHMGVRAGSEMGSILLQ